MYKMPNVSILTYSINLMIQLIDYIMSARSSL